MYKIIRRICACRFLQPHSCQHKNPNFFIFLKQKIKKWKRPPIKKRIHFTFLIVEFENAMMEASHAGADASSIPRYLFTKRAALSEPSISLRLHEHETRFQQPMP
jgi:hypothetical protein